MEFKINFFKKYILFFWDNSYKQQTDIEKSKKILLLNYLFTSVIIFLLPFAFLALVQNQFVLAGFDITVAVLILIARIYYYNTRNYKFLLNFIIYILGVFFIYLFAFGGYENSGPLWAFLFPVSSFFLLGRKQGLQVVSFFFSVILLITIIGPFPNIYSVGYKIRYMGAFWGTTIVTYFVEYIRYSAQKQLTEKNNELQNYLAKLDKKEQELSEREAYYRTLFEKSNDAVFLMCNNTFVDCNNKALDLFGCKRNEILGKTPMELSPPTQPDGSISQVVASKRIKTALTGKHQNFEWVFKKIDGNEFYSEISLDKIEFNDRKSILSSIRDISQRKIAEQKLTEAKEKAERSERIKADFLAQMSHEIRTPINTIMNYTYLLKTEFEDKVSEDNKGSFHSIENAANRLLRTIDLILNISDIEAGTYEPKPEEISLLEKIIIPVTNELKQSAQNKKLKLEVLNNIKHNQKIIADSYTLYQTIVNLIDNAIKYTKIGKISVELFGGKNYITVNIKDTGIGISKDYIPHLFDKFSQEEAGYTRKFEGNGLGLALVKKYCEINNIEISVSSQKDVGTTFSLKIPLAA